MRCLLAAMAVLALTPVYADGAFGRMWAKPLGPVVAYDPGPIPLRVSTAVVLEGHAATVEVMLDLGEVEGALGSIQGAVRFDPDVIRLDSLGTGTFEGAFEANLGETARGRATFAAINTAPERNSGSFAMLRLSFTAVGAWGQSSEVEVEISELMSTTFEDYVDLVAPESGTVLIDPGAYGFSLSGPTEVDEGQTVEFGLHLGLEALRPRIGSFRGRIHLDERVIQVDSVVQGDFGGVLEANLAPLRDSGFIRIAGVNGSPPDGDTYRVARLVGIVGGGGGDSTFISFDLEEAFSGGSFVDLTAFSEPAPPLALTVRRETVWGDPSGDEVVSSLDALVCLSFVVGKEIPPGFSGALCDVAPDGAGGFTGAVTALDALAILSYVVGKPLPDGFRLGGSA